MGSSFGVARRIFVRLDTDDLEKLQERAQSQRRHPSDEAALLIREALRNTDGPEEKCGEGASLCVPS